MFKGVWPHRKYFNARMIGGAGMVRGDVGDVRAEVLKVVGRSGVTLVDAMNAWCSAGIPVLAVSRVLTALFLSGELVLTEDKWLVPGPVGDNHG